MAPRPVYIAKLGRSIPKKTVRELISRRTIAPDLPCPPGACCRAGAAGLLGDARWHTLYARVASLRQLADTDRPFRWNELRARAERGLDLAQRINAVSTREGLNRVDDAALRAILACAGTAQGRRRTQAAWPAPAPGGGRGLARDRRHPATGRARHRAPAVFEALVPALAQTRTVGSGDAAGRVRRRTAGRRQRRRGGALPDLITGHRDVRLLEIDLHRSADSPREVPQEVRKRRC